VEQIVFLERDSLEAQVRRPAFAHSWEEYGKPAAAEVVPRLARASIAIVNKTALRAETIAFALILALRRNLIAYREDVARGLWQKSERFCLSSHPIRDLHGATLGIFGEGSLGQGVASLARAFGMRVLFADHAPPKAEGIVFTPADQVLREADIVSLHLPATPQTLGMIGQEELAKMKRGALLINTARGGLVDEHALADALRQGVIGGAGFDVLSAEPPAPGNPLLAADLPNFILTPHVAWASREAMQALADQLMDNVEAFARGAPRNVVA
jgi:glycerate dehydrogenase